MAKRIPVASSTVSVTYPKTVSDGFELTERLFEQEYFWASEWQQAEREADEDIKAGRVKRFSNAQEAIVHLRSLGT